MTEVVECHSGFEYAERPLAVNWEGSRYAVLEILAQWRTSGGRCFRVRTEEEKAFELFYSELHDEWRVKPV